MIAYQDKIIVKKPIVLCRNISSQWTLRVYRILDIFLAKYNLENSSVTIYKSELEKYFKVTRIELFRFQNWANMLSGEICLTRDTHTPIALFEPCTLVKDKHDAWYFTLHLTSQAKEIFDNLDNSEHVEYELKDMLNITSLHSYFMYMYLLKMNHFEIYDSCIPLDDLRKIINAEDAAYYLEFKQLKNKLLKPINAEINNSTNITYQYSPVREGRKTKYIQITLLSNNQNINGEQNFTTLKNIILDEWKLSENRDELKLLDVFYEKIHREKIENRTIYINLEELKSIYNKTNFTKEDIDKLMDSLFTQAVNISPNLLSKRRTALFETCAYEFKNNYVVQVELTCTPTARKYFF